MSKSDREIIFGETGDTHLYCIHCERTYLKDAFRGSPGHQMCPYIDCDGDAVIDAWEWSKVRYQREDLYPEIPIHGTVYPLYD